MERLLEEQKSGLRSATLVALVSYDRLMDSRAVQEQLQAFVDGERGWLKNIRLLVILYDGQARRVHVVGSTRDDPTVERMVERLANARV